MMRSASAPTSVTPGSSSNSPTSVSDRATKTTVTMARKPVFQKPVNHTARPARSGFPAPRF